MLFSVITPSYNANRWIQCCVASVADQDAGEVEHIVQDGGSTDGTGSYLRREPRVRAFIEKDEGMYDAINRGWRKAKGEFVVHLNADEQLLPGALAAVRERFLANPEIDVVIAGTLMCAPNGAVQAYRKPLRPPLSILLTSHHPIPSCSVFLRRSSFVERPFLYDPAFRMISDSLLMVDIVQSQKHISLLHRFTSAFFLTGENLGLCQSDRAKAEYRYQMSLAPKWLTLLKPLVRSVFHVRKLLAGHYCRERIEYQLYTRDDFMIRQRFGVTRASGVYRPGQTIRQDS
jgi:glycosyltransferase involved in cell wall biosynthesis